mmetsp:Transcript_49345/g.119678  ORF Transcript_49345/g.119678 Transcript_49345/m.119678 type:complete len:284 (+) Transcript_49345:1733-2584(+)
MNVAQANPIEQLEKDGFFPLDERKLPDAFVEVAEGKDELGITLTEHHLAGDYDDSPPGIPTQLKMLFTRELKNIARDTASIGARFGLTIFLSLLIGLIFRDVGATDPTVPQNLNSSFGALIMVLMMGMFGTAQPALLAFPEERPVFLREYSTNHYSVFSYFLSRLSMEMFVTGLQVLVQVLISYFLINFQSGFAIFWANCYALAMSSTALAVLLGRLLSYYGCDNHLFKKQLLDDQTSHSIVSLFVSKSLQVARWRTPSLDKRCFHSCLCRKCSLLVSLWHPS